MPGARRPPLGGSASWRERAASWAEPEDPVDEGGGRFGGLWSLIGNGSSGNASGTKEETQGLLSYAEDGLRSATETAGGLVSRGLGGSMGMAVQAASIGRQQWMLFFLLLAAGCLLMGLSLASFPLIVLAPHKFAGVFTAGSLCFLGSFAALKGVGSFVAHLTSWERLPHSAGYFGSMLGTLWASLWYRSTILTVAFCALQISQLLWFLVSYIPGGSMMLGLVCDKCSDVLKQICCSCCGLSKPNTVPL